MGEMEFDDIKTTRNKLMMKTDSGFAIKNRKHIKHVS